MKMLNFVLFVVLRLSASTWIDPLTPIGAHQTTPMITNQFHSPRKETNRTHLPTHKKTNAKTKSPSMTPSLSPTSSPTSSPTHTTMYEDTIYSLVFSDEFEESDRRFDDGYDPAWTALEKNDYTNDALHYYSASNVRTSSGSLIISTEPAQIPVLGYDDVEKKKTHIKKYFRSGMLQSWNKFCFTGGIIEAEVELPGEADVGGLWPAFWILGNFARHTYVGSADNIWPWSLSTCSKQYSKSQKIRLVNRCKVALDTRDVT